MIDVACNVMGIKDLDDETKLLMVKELGFWRNLLNGISSLFLLANTTPETVYIHLSQAGKAITSTFSEITENMWDIFRSMSLAEIEEFNSTGYEDLIKNGAK